ncbi:hypothetical protein [Pseudomonas fluorescens]
MSVKSEMERDQNRLERLQELNEQERIVVKMFRELDEQSKKDIMRFLVILLSST